MSKKYLDNNGVLYLWSKIKAYVQSVITALDLSDTYAPKASPALTGTPTAPTADAGTNTTQIATTAFVKGAVDTAASSRIPTTEKGAANGVATLDSGGKVPTSQLPSYVDDVVECYPRTGQTALSANWLATDSLGENVITPESGKIYVLMAAQGDYSADSQFRWGGSAYVKLNDGGVSEITNAEIDAICV